ncbi:hypothetical protein [Brucella intermedia]|uniref:hypothetical protein n=1 Tax=Brucella intermedia TaxID=94625 RepID=UPI0023615672|nr:hypothetical protein [Brucella intermedia]
MDGSLALGFSRPAKTACLIWSTNWALSGISLPRSIPNSGSVLEIGIFVFGQSGYFVKATMQAVWPDIKEKYRP